MCGLVQGTSAMMCGMSRAAGISCSPHIICKIETRQPSLLEGDEWYLKSVEAFLKKKKKGQRKPWIQTLKYRNSPNLKTQKHTYLTVCQTRIQGLVHTPGAWQSFCKTQVYTNIILLNYWIDIYKKLNFTTKLAQQESLRTCVAWVIASKKLLQHKTWKT